jgi:hypothetical protein
LTCEIQHGKKYPVMGCWKRSTFYGNSHNSLVDVSQVNQTLFYRDQISSFSSQFSRNRSYGNRNKENLSFHGATMFEQTQSEIKSAKEIS